MSAQIDSAITYFRFTQCPDQVATVARRDNPQEKTTFRFEDDVWTLLDLLRPHERDYEATIKFSDLAAWLRQDAKRYIAHLWLRCEPEANSIHQILVDLRQLGRLLPDFDGEAIDLRAQHAREFSRRYLELNLSPVSNNRARRSINNFMTFVRQQHPKLTGNDFNIEFPKSKTETAQYQPSEQALEAVIATERLALIIDACSSDVQAYNEYMRTYIDPIENKHEYQNRQYHERSRRLKEGLSTKTGINLKLNHLLGRAIKGQAVILEICVGRRPAAICNTPANVRTEKTEWLNEAGQKEKGVMVRFREMKVRNVDEDVPCPDAFGELALHAIATARELTSELRRNNPEWKDFLFLVPNKKRKGASVLTRKQLNQYLNGQNGNEMGIIQRYEIPGGKIKTKDFRLTRATKAWLGGLQIHEVSFDLGHIGPEMAVRHYIVGSQENRRRLQFLMDHGALSGALEDFVGGREIVQTRLGKRHVEIMKRQGRVLTATRYGYCALCASSGPCPTANPCYLGPGEQGDGCDHHVLSPDALPALEEDKEVIEATIATYQDDPGYGVWVEKNLHQLQLVNMNIERAKSLQKRLDSCDATL